MCVHVCAYCFGERFSSNICFFQERKESSAREKEVQWQVLPKSLADFLLGVDIRQEKKETRLFRDLMHNLRAGLFFAGCCNSKEDGKASAKIKRKLSFD